MSYEVWDMRSIESGFLLLETKVSEFGS